MNFWRGNFGCNPCKQPRLASLIALLRRPLFLRKFPHQPHRTQARDALVNYRAVETSIQEAILQHDLLDLTIGGSLFESSQNFQGLRVLLAEFALAPAFATGAGNGDGCHNSRHLTHFPRASQQNYAVALSNWPICQSFFSFWRNSSRQSRPRLGGLSGFNRAI